MKTIKQQMKEEEAKFKKSYGYSQELRDEIQKRLRQEDKTELWQIEDAIADLKHNFSNNIL